jgi:hypothetical protein
MLNNIGTILHHNIVQGDKTYHKEYTPSSNPINRRNRAGQRLNSTIMKNGAPNFNQYASVTPSQLGQALLHSLVPGFISLRPISVFEHVIKSFANQSLWLSLDFDGDGSWILDGMLAQSLIIIHDGSYMKEVTTHISLVATMIYCRIAKAQCKCTWAKQSASAGSYPGEILSEVMTQLILNAAASKCHDAIPLLWLIVITMGLFPTGMNPSAHFLPTSCRQIFFAISKTLLPLSHSMYNTNTCSHMPMTQRDGKTVC